MSIIEFQWLGPYRIVGKLGRGGMGTVYHGIHHETGEAAAIKILSPTLAEEEGFRVRFEAEIETLRKLNHPNIVRLSGFGQQEGHLFYAMEVVEGNSLEEELRRGRRFEWREVAEIGIAVCLALRHAHDRGIIHRDIKPANLLLTPDGKLKLSDFGIARLFGYSRLTLVGNVVGTAEYMAPEQAEGLPVDARSDLYSLGAVLYALLARRPLFRGKSLPDLLHKQRFERPEPLRKHAADVPAEFEGIINQLLEKDPAKRIANATILGRRLESLLQTIQPGSETVEADYRWFGEDDSMPSDELPTLIPLSEDVAVAPTIDQPIPALPATIQLGPGEATSPLLASDDSAIIVAEDNPPPEKSAPQEDAVPEPTNFSPRNHFVPVGEDELDPVNEDQPEPPMFSWQTGALVVALLLAGGSFWWFLQPPTADALYNRIAERMETDSPNDQLRLPSDISDVRKVINELLIRYPDDARCSKAQAWDDELEQRRQQWEFEQRISGRNTEKLSPLEQMYLEAISQVRLNPTQATTQLQAMIDLFGDSEEERGATKQCLDAARRRLATLRVEVKQLADDQSAAIGERLDAADAIQTDDPDRARAIYRAVVELYSDKPWAAELVRRAHESLEKAK